MKIAILILDEVLKSTAYGIDELFNLNNKISKSKDEEEIITEFVGLSSNRYFDCKDISNKQIYEVIIIPPTSRNQKFNIDKKIIDWLIYQHYKGAILTSACLGSFILAKTKLLDGKKATTHWAYEELFKKEFPNIDLKVDKILVDEKSIITAGGVNAYLDLCLYIIEKFHSNKTSTQIANLMLIDRGRDSQQSYKSFSTIFLYDDKQIKQSVIWMKENIHKQISIKDVANEINLTLKTFNRRFKKSLNTTAIKYLQDLRVEKAKELLISTNKSFAQITFEVGYFDENSFRKLFKSRTSINPMDYRKKFKQYIYF
ncbi:hypothetical protein CPU12_04510 [Malaciobacter molluscorum LMG 25693]|uniref:Transcriptional regulator, AraC family n=1 Tax=Malaciobacter molluscorum LMG 25693 TaxID=870501 RepID=A0A2G1DJ68_9BACT|nr:helix-turn-helix domain-containing protein [Malaciobacter molluscorum]AXX91658.1 transcriptional regulator, AraC family [Malaciobacter molluscorum LMG 25693]PHO18548.1 hypothetical protein CPU12_04510 [Malaciobacter molluscorum LMG 25693]